MIRRRERLLLALSQSSIIDDGDASAAAEAICAAAAEGLAVDRASLWELDADARSMRCVHLYDAREGGHRRTPALRLAASDFPRYFEALQRERTITADDAPRHPDASEFAHGYLDVLGIGAMLDAPVRQHGRLVGILCAEHRGGPRHWRQSEVLFAASLCDLQGRALTAAERKDYRDRLERLNQDLESRVQARTADLQEALDRLDEARQHLVQRERFAALGELVAGIAHEINTPEGVIVTASSHARGVLQGLRHARDRGELTRTAFESALAELEESLAMAERNAERAAGLIESFKRTSADRTHDARSPFELGKVVADVLATLQPLLRRCRVQVQLDAAASLACDSYPGAIGQIVTNLVVNACTHGYGPTPPPGATVRVVIRPLGDRARIDIADDGIGMDEAVRERAFEPFFTTARSLGGTGLGLGIVRGLVNRTLGGDVSMMSAPGRGTCVRLEFPRVAPA